MEKRGTVCVTVDNLGSAAEIFAGHAHRPDPDEPGVKTGLPRLLRLFADLKISATFFVEGWNALHHPSALRSITGAGHEVALHGWIHEVWAALDEHDQERLLFDGTAALRSLGIDPRGFRAPGGYRGTRTAAVLADLGYRYDSSITRETENQPPAVHRLDDRLICVPWQWEGNDYWQYYMNPGGQQTGDQARKTWLGQIRDVAETGGLVTLTMHPFVSGADDAKCEVYRDILRAALDDERLTVTNAGALVEGFLEAEVNGVQAR
ncbi:MAG: polysaccharide deacetylase family protein [Trebonia sp.]